MDTKISTLAATIKKQDSEILTMESANKQEHTIANDKEKIAELEKKIEAHLPEYES